MNIYLLVAFALCAVGILLNAVGGFQNSKQTEHLLDVIAKQALRISELETEMVALDEHYKAINNSVFELDKRMKDFPVEDLDSRYKAEKAWNDGVNAIMSFGLDSLNKGGSKNG